VDPTGLPVRRPAALREPQAPKKLLRARVAVVHVLLPFDLSLAS